MTTHQTAETETVKDFYATLNRGDIPALVEFLHPEITRVEFEGSPGAGRFQGLVEMQAHFERGRSTWAEGSCDPQKFVVTGGRLVVDVHVRVRLKNSTEWLDGRIADGFAFKDGKIIEFHSFTERKDALKWAGAPEAKEPKLN